MGAPRQTSPKKNPNLLHILPLHLSDRLAGNGTDMGAICSRSRSHPEQSCCRSWNFPPEWIQCEKSKWEKKAERRGERERERERWKTPSPGSLFKMLFSTLCLHKYGNHREKLFVIDTLGNIFFPRFIRLRSKLLAVNLSAGSPTAPDICSNAGIPLVHL